MVSRSRLAVATEYAIRKSAEATHSRRLRADAAEPAVALPKNDTSAGSAQMSFLSQNVCPSACQLSFAVY